MQLNKTMVVTLGEDVFDRLRLLHGFAGESNPGWLQTAVILAKFFAPVPEWAMSNGIIALIKQATVDCKRALAQFVDPEDVGEGLSDAGKKQLQEMQELLEAFRAFFLHNGLAEPIA